MAPRLVPESDRSEFPIVLATGGDRSADSDLNLFCGPLFLYLAESANHAFFTGIYADPVQGRFSLACWAKSCLPARRPQQEELLLEAIKFVNQYANEICEDIRDWKDMKDVLVSQLLPSKPATAWFRAIVFRVPKDADQIRQQAGKWTVERTVTYTHRKFSHKVDYRVAWIIGSQNDGYSYAASGRGWEFRVGEPNTEATPIDRFKAVKAKYVCLVPYALPVDD
jgi:hypothetical protein